MKITYVPSDLDAPGFYRCLSPGRMLVLKGGHEISLPKHTQEMQANGRLKTTFDFNDIMNRGEGDLVVLQQWKSQEFAEGGVDRLRGKGASVIADVDDNYEQLPEWNPAFYGTHPYRMSNGAIRNRAERRRTVLKQEGKTYRGKMISQATNSSNRNHMKRIFEQADAMTVSTPYLKELYAKHNGNITVVRNYLDWDIWKEVEPQYQVERWQNRIRLGYLGVFRYRRGDLEVIRALIPKILARHPEVDFVANGHDVHDYLEVPKRQRVVVKEYNFFPYGGGDYPVGRKTAHLDIGLVPLAEGGLSEGKSHLKGMEYNAAGIPFIATDTESYRYWTDDWQNGFRVVHPAEWEDWIEMLISDDAARRKMGEIGRLKAERHSIQKNWPEWQDCYEKIEGDKLTAIARGAIARGAVQKVSELRNLLSLASRQGNNLKLVVEVGSARGGTFWALSQIAADDALMVSIDIPAGSPLDVRGGKDVYGDRDRSRLRTYVREGQRCVLIDGNSQSLASLNALFDSIGTQKIDMLFIDADHRYAGVKRDYELYSPLVREGGVIAFHDVIRQNDLRSGVHILWAELKQEHPFHYEWVGRDNWGLGTWGGIGALLKEYSRVAA